MTGGGPRAAEPLNGIFDEGVRELKHSGFIIDVSRGDAWLPRRFISRGRSRQVRQPDNVRSGRDDQPSAKVSHGHLSVLSTVPSVSCLTWYLPCRSSSLKMLLRAMTTPMLVSCWM